MSYCNLEIPKVYSLSKIGVTQSLLKTWMSCHLKFLFCINRVWYSLSGGKANSTGFGTLFHHVLEQTYLKYQKNKTFPSGAEITNWLDSFIKEFPDQISEWAEQDAAAIEVMLPFYLNFYSSDFKGLEILHAEKQLEAELAGCCLRSKIDLIFSKAGCVYSMDHKTSSRIDEDAIVKALSFDFQHQFYTYSIETELGVEVVGSYHNVIRRPQDKMDGDDYDGYKKALTAKLRKNPGHYFKRFIVNFSKQDKENYTNELVDILQEIKACIAGENKFKRNIVSCLGGYSPCPFLDACSSNSLSGYEFGTVFFPELDLPEINNLPEETYYGNSKTDKGGKSRRTPRSK